MSEGRGSRAQEILETATRLFAGRGYDGVSVRDICAELDLNSSVISYYFQGKRGLYLEVLRRQFAAYARVLAEIAASGRPPREQLADLGRAMRDFQHEYPHFSALTVRESGCPGPEYLQALREYEAEHGDALTELIRNGQRQGAFRRGPRAEYLALLLTLMFNGAATARAFSASLPPERIEADYFEAVESLLAEGLLAEAEDGGRRLGKQSAKPRGTWG
jgi:Transcriptional regulator